jgi:hypothetical protein
VYQDALGRAVDATGLASWTAALQKGMTRAQVASAIFGSLEYQQDLAQGLYQQFLSRPADASELSAAVKALQGGARDEAVIADLVDSAEFFTS